MKQDIEYRLTLLSNSDDSLPRKMGLSFKSSGSRGSEEYLTLLKLALDAILKAESERS